MTDQIKRGVFGTVGVLGGGQLALMMGEAAQRMGVRLIIVDSDPECPAATVAAEQVEGSFLSYEKVKLLVTQHHCDVITVEIEHVDVSVLEQVELEFPGVQIHPHPWTLRVIQDKFLQKVHLRDHGLPVVDHWMVTTFEDLIHLIEQLDSLPLMLKSRRCAYDGRGNRVISSRDPQVLQEAWKSLNPQNSTDALYVEAWCPFSRELAVMVARSRPLPTGPEIQNFPVVETWQRDNICHVVRTPVPDLPADVITQCASLARQAVTTFWGAGIFGVEMFLVNEDRVVINEIAPRPHNSGHFSIEACSCSQFEQHLRCVLGLPLGHGDLQVAGAVMINVLGSPDEKLDTTLRVPRLSLSVPGASLHWYGKTQVRSQRKMGHITLVANDLPTLDLRLSLLQ